jgi:alcohol dehydrogenase class IV
MHALAHPLGALYDAHHGLLNAILMPYVLVVNREAIDSRVTRLSSYLGLNSPGFDSFLQWVLDLREQVGIPHDLSGIGIPANDLELIGNMASEDPSAAGNPVPLTPAQYSQLCQQAIQGILQP